jgi:hypothetical protein
LCRFLYEGNRLRTVETKQKWQQYKPLDLPDLVDLKLLKQLLRRPQLFTRHAKYD